MKRLLLILVVLLHGPPTFLRAADAGQDLRLTYRSAIDNTDQPYRLYVPKAYDGKTPLPLVVALHGTGGTEATLFEGYREGHIKEVAEKHGVFVLSPYGRGITEYRGLGENDILCVLAEVRQHYRIDADRIYCTGHSMGGTGAAYLAFHHPELFAAVAPLAAAYSFPWLAPNARHIPFWWILGGKDHPFYLTGVRIGAERMIRMGYPTKLDILPGENHGDWVPDAFDRVFEWFLKHRRVAHPREYVFAADTPMHGGAYSTAINRIAQPGTVATLAVLIGDDASITVQTRNVVAFSVVPDPVLLDPAKPFTMHVDGINVFHGIATSRQEVECMKDHDHWTAAVVPRRDRDLRRWRINPVATAAEGLDVGGIESPLGNWIADAMRDATKADIALFNRSDYRGLAIPKGSVDIIDVIQAVRPFDQYLVTANLTGAEVLKILEDNIRKPVTNVGEDSLVQVSGMRYSFDRDKPKDARIVSSDLNPARTYKVVMEGQVPERETIHLAGAFGKFACQITDVPFTTALYAHAVASPRITPQLEGRVREVTPK